MKILVKVNFCRKFTLTMTRAIFIMLMHFCVKINMHGDNTKFQKLSFENLSELNIDTLIAPKNFTKRRSFDNNIIRPYPLSAFWTQSSQPNREKGVTDELKVGAIGFEDISRSFFYFSPSSYSVPANSTIISCKFVLTYKENLDLDRPNWVEKNEDHHWNEDFSLFTYERPYDDDPFESNIDWNTQPSIKKILINKPAPEANEIRVNEEILFESPQLLNYVRSKTRNGKPIYLGLKLFNESSSSPYKKNVFSFHNVWANEGFPPYLEIRHKELEPKISSNFDKINLVKNQSMNPVVILCSEDFGYVENWVVTPDLPEGLSLEGNTTFATISGTSLVSGLSNHTVTAKNQVGISDLNITLEIVTNPPVFENMSYSFSGTIGEDVSIIMENTGSSIEKHSIIPELPDGLSYAITSEGISINGSSTAPVRSSHVITISNEIGSSNSTLSIDFFMQPPAIKGNVDIMERIILGEQIFEVEINNSGGPIDNWTITPDLPDGVSFETSETKALIFGTPKFPRVGTHKIIASNIGGTSEHTLTLRIYDQWIAIDTFWNNTTQENWDNSDILRVGSLKKSYNRNSGDFAKAFFKFEPNPRFHTEKYGLSIPKYSVIKNAIFELKYDFSPMESQKMFNLFRANTIYGPASYVGGEHNSLLKIQENKVRRELDRKVSFSHPKLTNYINESLKNQSQVDLGLELLFEFSEQKGWIEYEYNFKRTTDEFSHIRGYEPKILIDYEVFPPPNISLSESKIAIESGKQIPTISIYNSGGSITSWEINPDLPDGLSFNSEDRTITGLSNSIMDQSFTVVAKNESGSSSKSVNVRISKPEPLISSPSQRSLGFVNSQMKPVKITLNPLGGAVKSWSFIPNLPDGLEFDYENTTISGTSNKVIDENFIVIAENEYGFAETFVKINFYKHRIKSTVAPKGSGSVLGEGEFGHKEQTTLEAIPFEGFVFSHWEGSISGSSNPIKLTVSEDHNITAVFEREYEVEGNVFPHGSGKISGLGKYLNGSDSLVTAIAEKGYAFSNWEGSISGRSNPINFAVSSDHNVTAVFVKEYELIVDSNPNSSVKIWDITNDTEDKFVIRTVNERTQYEYYPVSGQSPVERKKLNENMVNYWDPFEGNFKITLLAIPNDQKRHVFSHWEGDISSKTNPITILGSSDMNVTAVFKSNFSIDNVKYYGFQPNIGSYGEINGTGIFLEGEEVTLTAIPDEGRKFITWAFFDDQSNIENFYKKNHVSFVEALKFHEEESFYKDLGIVNLEDNPITFNLTRDLNVTAVFSLANNVGASVEISDNFNGYYNSTAKVIGNGYYAIGESVSLSAVDVNNTRFSHWEFYDGRYNSSIDDNKSNPLNFINSGKINYITAVFEEELSFNANSLTKSRGTVLGGGKTSNGYITAIPNEGYYFYAWLITPNNNSSNLFEPYIRFYGQEEIYNGFGADFTAIFRIDYESTEKPPHHEEFIVRLIEAEGGEVEGVEDFLTVAKDLAVGDHRIKVFDNGKSLELTALPYDGYEFKYWEFNGREKNQNNPLNIYINDGDMDIKPFFEIPDDITEQELVEDKDIESDERVIVLYNTATNEEISLAEIEAGGTSWMLIDQAQYPDYQHPAYYNNAGHFVVDSGGKTTNGWKLANHESGSIGQNLVNELVEEYQISIYDGFGQILVFDEITGQWSDPSSMFNPEKNWQGYSQASGLTKKFKSGESIRLKIQEESGYEFWKWDGDIISIENPISIDITSHLIISTKYRSTTDFLGGSRLFDFNTRYSTDNDYYLKTLHPYGWYESSWFGNYYVLKNSGWYFHQVHGWIWPEMASLNSVWFYQNNNWRWTKDTIYPFIFDHATNSWLYLQSSKKGSRFYHYGHNKWFNVEDEFPLIDTKTNSSDNLVLFDSFDAHEFLTGKTLTVTEHETYPTIWDYGTSEWVFTPSGVYFSWDESFRYQYSTKKISESSLELNVILDDLTTYQAILNYKSSNSGDGNWTQVSDDYELHGFLTFEQF